MVQVICWVAGWLLSHTTAWKMHAAQFLSALYQFEENMISVFMQINFFHVIGIANQAAKRVGYISECKGVTN